jgi:group I intron endonuclease
MSCGIYRITSPSCRVYIGQSICIERRFTGHRLKSSNYILNASLKKYGANSHTFKIIHEIPNDRDILDEFEKFYIELYTYLGFDLFNLRAGGVNGHDFPKAKTQKSESRIGKKHSAETRKKISESNKGRIVSKEQRDYLRQIKTGTKASDETRAKLSALKKGKKQSFLHRSRTSKSKIGNKNCVGRIISEETRQKMSVSIKKALQDKKAMQ